MWLMSRSLRMQVHFKPFTSTRPRWILHHFLVVFSFLFLEFRLFSLLPDYFCCRLASYVWAACPDPYTLFRPTTVRRSCGCFLWGFFIWSLTFRVWRVILVFFPTHFLFGLARMLPFRVAQTQCSLRALCCSNGPSSRFGDHSCLPRAVLCLLGQLVGPALGIFADPSCSFPALFCLLYVFSAGFSGLLFGLVLIILVLL